MSDVRPRIAVIRGVFAKPGVSKNRRLYTKEHIAEAVNEAQGQIASGNAPTVFAMLTHHGARDASLGDVTRTAGRITKVGLDARGWGTYEAELADTQAGRDVAALTTPEQPYLKGVSMASMWKGTPRVVKAPDGMPAETADGFSLRGIDFTHNPGIPGAEISSAELSEADQGALIYESIEEDVFVEHVEENAATEAGDAPGNGNLPYGSVTYADPGYQADKQKRYPIDTKARVRAAWSYVNQKKNAGKYTATQLKRVKARIQKAAKKFGIDIQAEADALTQEITEVLEAYASTTLDNGQGTVSVNAYVTEPAELAAVGRRVAMSALQGLLALDPDNDGDVDTDDGTDESDDGMESCPSCGADVPDDSNFCPACGAPIPLAETAPNRESEGTVPTEANTEGAATESAPITMTPEQLAEMTEAAVAKALEAAGVKPTEEVEESDDLKAARKLIAEAEAAKPAPAAAPAPAVTEAAPAGFTAEQVKEMIAEASQEAARVATEAALDAARKEIQEAGPRRRGLVSKHILEQSPDELYGEGRDLSKASTQDLEKLTDEVLFPLIAS